MPAQSTFGIAFWGFLAFYGLALYAVAPSARTVEGFFRGRDSRGCATSRWMLTSSIFIAWILYALLLGTNAYGLLICTTNFLLPLVWLTHFTGERSHEGARPVLPG